MPGGVPIHKLWEVRAQVYVIWSHSNVTFAPNWHDVLLMSAGVAHLVYLWVEVMVKQQEAEHHPQHTRLTPLDLELLEVAGEARFAE